MADGGADQEPAVERPRIRIAWIMAVIAIVALNLGAIRAASDHLGPVSSLLAAGALPMANVLSLGLFVSCVHLRSRLFLIGFEALGALALAFYLAAILCPSHRESFAQRIVVGYMRLAWDVWPTGAARTIPRTLIACSALSLWATWPQLALAVVGGVFTRLPVLLRAKGPPRSGPAGV
jgi:hypothetical protein